MKKTFITKMSVPLAALLAGLLVVGGTLSYLSSVTPTLVNIFQIGSVKTELMEPEFKVVDTTITKNPYVSNVGDVDCIVRLKIEVSPAEIQVPMEDNPSCKGNEGMNAQMLDEDAKKLWEKGYRFWLNFNTKPGDNGEKAAWLYKDGYWYYQGVLAPSEDTSELFTEVKWLLLEEGYFKEIQDFDIYIKKETTFASYIDKDNVEHSAVVDGVYSQEKAQVIWNVMKDNEKIF